jgi:hypothetical protein
MTEGRVEISQNGRAGQILYYEDQTLIQFDWEFAGSPRALVLVFGSPARVWDEKHPEARGRQAEIYGRICAEIIRQKAPESSCEIDLEDGMITVISPGASG